MTDRAMQLHATADAQISELLALISTLNAEALRLPCPGRAKLGDGTIAASLRHTVDNYQRIAAFVATSDPTSDGAQHIAQYTASDVDLDLVVGQLAASGQALRAIADLSDSQLDAIPPKDSFRFCDGQRTLEQVLTSLLRHPRHQIDTLDAALPSQPGTP